MSITKEIATSCLIQNNQFNGPGLNCVMHQISFMDELPDLIEVNNLVSINVSTNLIDDLEEYLKQ